MMKYIIGIPILISIFLLSCIFYLLGGSADDIDLTMDY